MRLILFLLFSTLVAHAAPRPNVLFIYADDQNYRTVGCYPESWPWVKTPHIDALAKNGIRFHAAYLGSWCMPSRATLLTARHPHAIESMSMEGQYPGSKYDPAKTPFIPAEMRKSGYHTAQIGKWHTGTDSGWGRDWDHQIVWNRPKHPENAGAYYDTQILSIDGVEKTVEGYPADNYTRWSLDYIRGKNRDKSKPWYLWLCYGSIHGPSKPAKRHLGMYKGSPVEVPADIFPPREGKPAYLDQMQAWVRGEDGYPVTGKGGEKFGESKKGKRYDEWVHQMNECVPAIDEGVGQLIAALKETGQYDNTLIIYTADQGFSMGHHGFRTKLAPYDANYRSPLIISMPKRFPSGQVCRTPVNATDLMTTLISLMDVKAPLQVHGRDLTPLLENPAMNWPHACLYEHMGNQYGSTAVETVRTHRQQENYQGVPMYTAVVQNGWKLIHYLDGESGEELYDLTNDPEELKNLVRDSAHEKRLAQMREALQFELERVEAGFIDSLR